MVGPVDPWFPLQPHVCMDFDLTKLKFISKSVVHRFNAIFLLILSLPSHGTRAQLAGKTWDQMMPASTCGRPVLSSLASSGALLPACRQSADHGTLPTRAARSMITTTFWSSSSPDRDADRSRSALADGRHPRRRLPDGASSPARSSIPSTTFR